MDVSLPNWNVKHLSAWSEIVDVKVRTEEVTDVDLEAAEEATLHARFQETRSKIALLSDSLSLLNHLRLDELAWVRYKN